MNSDDIKKLRDQKLLELAGTVGAALSGVGSFADYEEQVRAAYTLYDTADELYGDQVQRELVLATELMRGES